MLLKANVKDVCDLLETKAGNRYIGIDDVNYALQKVHIELD